MLIILLILAQECLSFLGGAMRSKKNAWADGGLRQANHHWTLVPNTTRLGTSRELFDYANAVGAAIPRLPTCLRPSTIRHFLDVCVASLKAGANHG